MPNYKSQKEREIEKCQTIIKVERHSYTTFSPHLSKSWTLFQCSFTTRMQMLLTTNEMSILHAINERLTITSTPTKIQGHGSISFPVLANVYVFFLCFHPIKCKSDWECVYLSTNCVRFYLLCYLFDQRKQWSFFCWFNNIASQLFNKKIYFQKSSRAFFFFYKKFTFFEIELDI